MGLVMEMRTRLLGARSVTAEAEITADLGGEVFCCAVRYEGTGAGGTLTVTAPEELSGLTATADVDAGTLAYEGEILAAGRLTEDGVSPAEALVLMLRQWKSGYIDECGLEKYGDGRALMLESRMSEHVIHRAWFDSGTLLPIRGELIRGGVTVLTCDFTDASVEGNT